MPGEQDLDLNPDRCRSYFKRQMDKDVPEQNAKSHEQRKLDQFDYEPAVFVNVDLNQQNLSRLANKVQERD